MKKILPILAIAALSGCASTRINDSTLQKRTLTIGDFGAFVLYKSETEGLAIGSVEIIKED